MATRIEKIRRIDTRIMHDPTATASTTSLNIKTKKGEGKKKAPTNPSKKNRDKARTIIRMI
jgi:hypothetical protein